MNLRETTFLYSKKVGKYLVNRYLIGVSIFYQNKPL